MKGWQQGVGRSREQFLFGGGHGDQVRVAPSAACTPKQALGVGGCPPDL